MKKYWDNIIEAIMTDTLKTVIKTAITLIFAIPSIRFFVRVSDGNNGNLNIVFNKNLLSLIISVIIVLILIFMWKILPKLRLFSNYKFLYKHKNNEYQLTVKSRTHFNYTRTIQAIALEDDIYSFDDGKYIWSGSSSSAEILEKEDYELRLGSNEAGEQQYSVHSKLPFKKYKTTTYTIRVDAYDENKTMKTNNCIYIIRPTKSIKLVFTVPSEVKVKNVYKKCTTRHGEKKTIYQDKIKPKHVGGVSDGFFIYTYKIRNPKLFMTYGIYWEWAN